jgi:hypothetical protein
MVPFKCLLVIGISAGRSMWPDAGKREREDAGRCLNKTLGGANHYPYTTAPRS